MGFRNLYFCLSITSNSFLKFLTRLFLCEKAKIDLLYRVTNLEEVNLLLSSYCQPQHKFNIVMPINLTQVVIGHTELMKNDVYYDTYCIAINTIFASLLPFVALMFFNVRIALKLRFGKRVSAYPIILYYTICLMSVCFLESTLLKSYAPKREV